MAAVAVAATGPSSHPAKARVSATLNLPTAVLSLAVSQDASHLYAGCHDGGVYDVDARSGKFQLIGRHGSYVSGVVRVPGSSPQLISAGYDGVLQWHDAGPERRPSLRKIQAHQFWSWQMALSADGARVASVTGQYLAGGLKYEPDAEREPSVKVYNAASGEMLHQFSHVPPVLSVAFSPTAEFLAAANLMGEVRVWDLSSGKQVAAFTSPDFTSWGTVKSHCYQGGIYALAFAPDGDNDLILAGMGPMRDPMAGNGKQTWQRYAWRQSPPKKLDQIHDGDHGNGHPESLVFHPSGRSFVMAGRLAQGKWNVGIFDASTGNLTDSLDTKGRIVQAVFSHDGKRLFLAGAVGQGKPKDGAYPDYGRIFVCDLT
jgi:WD40 repeat protein